MADEVASTRPELIARLSTLTQSLSDLCIILGQSEELRHKKWHDAYMALHAPGNDLSETARRTLADNAVVHYDTEAKRIRGEIRALEHEVASLHVIIPFAPVSTPDGVNA